jgi:hypothetical protein
MNACLIEGLVVQASCRLNRKVNGTITQPLQATYKASIESDQINGDAEPFQN